MRVLALDPGSKISGYAILEKKGREFIYIDSGVLRFKEEIFLERIPGIFEQGKDLLLKYKPDVLALESLIYVKSPTALMKLAQTRGILIAACLHLDKIPVYEYSPNLIKTTVTGHGHADKESVQKFISHILKINQFKTHDESDALAVGLCHLMQNSFSLTKASSPKKGGSLAKSLSHRLKGIDI